MSNEYNPNRQSDSAWGPMPDPDPIYQGRPPYPQQPPYGPPPYGQTGSGYGYQNYQHPYGPYGYGGPVPPAFRMQKASFGQRFVSWLVDSVILGTLTVIPMFVFMFFAIILEEGSRYSSARAGFSFLIFMFGLLVAFGLVLVYYLISIGKGQTVGNRVAGMRFVDANGAPPGTGKAFLRLIVQYFVSGFFLIGYLWMLWDPEQQTLHDKVAGIYGVTTNTYKNFNNYNNYWSLDNFWKSFEFKQV